MKTIPPKKISMNDTKYFFHSEIAKDILSAIKHKQEYIELSVDLNISRDNFKIIDDKILFDENNVLDSRQLKKIVKKDKRVFLLSNGELNILEYRDEGYYKLVPTDGAPTVEISGVKMHKSKDIDPFINAKHNAEEVVYKGHYVLDTCGGLGYTAIWAHRLGAKEVITFEKSEYILKIRNQNPWSDELNQEGITEITGDASALILKLNSGYFDSIIHDPPRLSLAGNLYGAEFYSELYRVLKKGGKLFHYTGNPHLINRGNSFVINAGKRLQNVGFRKIELKPQLLGLKAIK